MKPALKIFAKIMPKSLFLSAAETKTQEKIRTLQKRSVIRNECANFYCFCSYQLAFPAHCQLIFQDVDAYSHETIYICLIKTGTQW